MNGLGTVVRTVYDQVRYADPTAIEGAILVVGGQPKPPPAAGELPDNVFDSVVYPLKKAAAPASAPATVAAPAPAAVPPPAPAGGTLVVAQPAPAAAPAAVAAPAGAVAPAAAAMVAPAAASQAAATAPAAAASQPAAAPKPPTRISLDEVDSIRFERSPSLTARFVGQPNLDFTMPGLSAKKAEAPPNAEEKKNADAPKGAEKKADTKKEATPPKVETKKAEAKKPEAAPKPEEKKTDGSDDVLAPPPGTTIAKFPKVEPKKNGIRDLCLSLFGLRDAKIKQVMVNGQTDKGPTSWRLDTTDSQDWPLVVRRAGNDISADLFLEPPARRLLSEAFQINVIVRRRPKRQCRLPQADWPHRTPTWPSIPRSRRLLGPTHGSI